MKKLALFGIVGSLSLVGFLVGQSGCSEEPKAEISGSGGNNNGSGGNNNGSGGTTNGSGGATGSGGGAGGAGGGEVCTVGTTPVTGPTAMAECNGVFTLGTYTGYFFTMSDKAGGGASTICPECTDVSCTPKVTSGMCASGKAGKVVASNYSTYWGAGIGWNLAQTVTAPNCEGGTPGTVNLAGKTIKATFDTAPTAFRIKLDTGNDADNLCIDISGKASIEYATSAFVNECWNGGKKTAITDAQLASIKAIQFQVPTNVSADVSFNFCVTSLSIE